MIDSEDTTCDWQRHTGDVCVLPVGSTEQHAAHMPLAADAIQAQFFGRMIAESLDAALLPTLPYANCLEHTGFRGSVSLKPETLMLVVRDIAAEVERQGFRILIIANQHGGNFALKPVARDINRMDRPLKILLVNCWEFCDPKEWPGEAPGTEIHAGERETSEMLVIRPDLVRGERIDMQPPTGDPLPLTQPDLTAFGAGHFNPAGALGWPSLATREKGEAAIASIRSHLLPYIKDRVQRLRAESRYAGPSSQE